VAAAPEEGTANRAVIAALGAAGLVALVLALLLRRRRRAG
jgi:LPXTG-motif cell wall-anchored protein